MSDATTLAQAAAKYASMGSKLVPIRARQKRPLARDWNLEHRLIADSARALKVFGSGELNVGVHLASSGLCSFDPDALPLTCTLLQLIGIDAKQVLDTGWRIEGNPKRGRAIFRVPEGVTLTARDYKVPAWRARELGVEVKDRTPDHGLVTIFELRGGALNKQDILPPSVHPDGHVYRTIGSQPERREDIPELRPELLDLWVNWDARVATFDRFAGVQRGARAPEVASSSRTASGSAKRDDRPIEPGSYLDIAQQWSELHEHNFVELLERNGYEPRGRDRWLAPGSQSGDPGVHLMKDRRHIVSHHGSDVLGGVTDDGVLTPHDLFDCWRLLEHDGNRGAAFRAAAEELGLAGPEVAFANADDEAGATTGTENHRDGDRVAPSRILRTWTPEQLRTLPPVHWLVKGIIPKSGIGTLFGASSVGKSLLLLDLCYAIARGVHWHDAPVEQGGVLYIAAEGGAGFPARQAAYEEFHGLTLDGVPFFLAREGLDLLGRVDTSRVIETAQMLGQPVLVVLDTLNRVMPGGDENKPEDMGKAIKAATTIAEKTGAFVLIVHHSGKDEKRGARGHSSLRAAVDTEIEVTKDGAQRRLSITKQRDGRDDLAYAFTLEVVEIGCDPHTGEPRSAPVAVACQASERPKSAPNGIWQRRCKEAIEDLNLSFYGLDDDGWLTVDEIVREVEAMIDRRGDKPPARLRFLCKQALEGLASKGIVEQADGRARLSAGPCVSKLIH